MSDNDTTAILEFLRVRFARVDETLARIIERQIKLGRVERMVADLHAQSAEHSIRMDRISQQIERIERRLDQAEAGRDNQAPPVVAHLDDQQALRRPCRD